MTRMLLTLLGIVALVLLMPVLARWGNDQHISRRRFRCVFRNAPALISVAYIITNLVLTLGRKPGSHDQITLSLLEPFQRAAANGTFLPIEGLILNTLLFLPMGYLLPQVFRKLRCRHVLFIGIVISGIIELCQLLFGIGWFDVNDLLFNFLGVLLGWHINRRQQKR